MARVPIWPKASVALGVELGLKLGLGLRGSPSFFIEIITAP